MRSAWQSQHPDKGCSSFVISFFLFSVQTVTCFTRVKLYDYFSDLARVEQKQRYTKFEVPYLKVMAYLVLNDVLLYAKLILFKVVKIKV